MRKAAALTFLLALAALPALAQERRQVVCTITVNSADEREAFRRFLPAERFEFVELVENGRPDWLASSCRQGIECDVLVVSGHFAGTEFYSSRPETRETLKVDEIERVQCSGSCGLFSKLKEAYLFGCDTLKPEPVRSAMPEIIRGLVRAGVTGPQAENVARALSEREAESSRGLMRRLFPGVPVIYGFSSLAPYGRVAGPLLERFFESGGGEDVATGRASERLLKLFGPSSMTLAEGMAENASCRYHDDRIAAARKLESLAAELRGEMPEARMAFVRVEKFLQDLPAAQRIDAGFIAARREIAADSASRHAYLALVRATVDPALRVRMAAVGRDLGWLDEGGHRAELALTIRDMFAAQALDFGEVDLICALNKDDALATELRLFNVATVAPSRGARAAAGACLGDPAAREGALRALASADEQEVRMTQALLRHRPIKDVAELRRVTAGITAMKASAAQVRALETLARHHIADPEILERLASLYSSARSAGVQRAIAEVFLRSDLSAIDTRALGSRLR
ncbi:MAG TPA: hypothetical protein VM051_05940, partial [Usitatibacter sp.]|nr:hypothetical protein [Usitatibacter sp.]